MLAFEDHGTLEHRGSRCAAHGSVGSLSRRRLRCSSLEFLVIPNFGARSDMSRSFDDATFRPRPGRARQASVLELAYSLALPLNLLDHKPVARRRWYSTTDLRQWTGATKDRVRVLGKRTFRRKSSQASCQCCCCVGIHCSEKRLSLPRKHSTEGFNWDWKRDEYLYAMVLETVVNPLGAADTRKGYRPLDLAQHVQQVFKVDDTAHSSWLKDVKHCKPKNIVLKLTILEAKNLKPSHAKGLLDPYAMVCVGKANRSPISPSGSPKTSSPAGDQRRKSSWETNYVRKTQVIKSTLHPQWNESIVINVKDLGSEEVHVYLWDYEEGSLPSSVKGAEKASGIRSLFRHLKSSVEYDKYEDQFIGFTKVQLRDIPATGLCQWFDLYRDQKLKTKTQGACRIRMELTTEQNVSTDIDDVDGPPSGDQCSIEDLYNVTKHIYRHEVKLLKRELAESAEGHMSSSLEELPARSKAVLDQFVIHHHFSKLTERLIELVVQLDCACSEYGGHLMSRGLIKETVALLETEWITMQGGQCRDGTFPDAALLSDTELYLFDRAATAYVEKCVRGLDDIPRLFPPRELQLDELNSKVSLLVSLVNLHIWPQNDLARKELTVLIVQHLQDDVKNWVVSQLGQVRPDAKQPLIHETKMLVSVLGEAVTVITPIYSVTEYFSRMDIDYFKIASLTMENRLAQKGQILMHKVDEYQMAYQKFRVNIKDSSNASMQLYMGLRDFVNMLRSNISEKEVFRVASKNYQTWFEKSVIFWLQTFREEGIRRMEKALEIDKDVVLVTSLVKYSNSSVDVLSCFSRMTTEWRQIDFHDADICLLGVTKITDTICDGARQYTEKIQTILENNGYYDIDDNNTEFDVKDRLCITMNNIEHVRSYLHKLPQWLNFEVVTQAMAIKHESERIGQQALDTLNNLVISADEDIVMRQAQLVHRITDKMAAELEKYMTKMLGHDSKTGQDGLLDYLKTNLWVLYERLESTILPHILHQIWVATLHCFSRILQTGRTTGYYKTMEEHLHTLKGYFLQYVGDMDSLDTSELMDIMATLELNTQESRDLILHYLQDITLEVGTPQIYYGHLAVRVGYMEETGNTATVYVTVDGARGLPAVTRKGLCDAFVGVSLQPCTEFTSRSCKTRVVNGTLHPEFNETFQFTDIPLHLLRTTGTVIVFTVWHRDAFIPNEFLGEVVLHLPDIPSITPVQTVDDVAAALLPLKNQPEPDHGSYQVLRERSEWDKEARSFLQRRRVLAGYESSLPMCKPVKALLARITGRRPATGSIFGHVPPL